MSFIDVGQEHRRTPSFARQAVAERRSRESHGWASKHCHSSSMDTALRRDSFNAFGDRDIGNNEPVPDVTDCSSGSGSSPDDIFGSQNSSHLFGRHQDGISFAQLSDDVFRFQRMVSDSRKSLNNGMGGSECRKKSIEEFGARLRKEIHYHRHNLEKLGDAGRSKAELTKLQRDFQCAWDSYQELKNDARGRSTDCAVYENPTVHLEDVAADMPNFGKDEKKAVAQREEEYATTMMREREEEMQKINNQVHTVNAIYKDLGQLVHSQQEQIDQLEANLETSKDNTQQGLEQLEEANGPSKWRRPFQQGQTGQQESNDRGEEVSDKNGTSEQGGFSFRWPGQFESLREDMGEVQNDISSIINGIMRKGKLLLLSCSAMGDVSNSPII
mmetsp:Transcript_44853/g.136980  ORF Transcript_44853/g.136980 Transcript_44853/m.136980 type:complete len:386 (-) Transcript_44853:415-1572(-)|eukprot:CAMPEP_0113536524 /NCGR_PEP_ID=MMETSP0015_2-20120614/6307_1 /TAXON_ID=2838 /ORGANISM="Odontella" /LENGTH=385 /DNA_ID=CAMNT_0000435895 /DNA_START=61 /DNA_END=1218 /DNA_ORIENTATION=+ /assembly_acc=CAM_ASM_000160